MTEVEIFRNIFQADPDFEKPGPIGMILGIEYAMGIITSGMFMTKPGKLASQNTIFGYIIGRFFYDKGASNASSYRVRCNLGANV